MSEAQAQKRGEAQTLYDIIGVPPTATEDEIKRAYRKKAFQLHPDRNPDDPMATEKFQQLSEAYEILKDPAKRERYDKFGNSEEVPQTPEDEELIEMLSQILGFGRSRAVPKGPKVSPSIRMIRVPLKTLYAGGSFTTKIDYHMICPKCHGCGSKTGVEFPVCPDCNGAGSLSPGGLQFLFPCKRCNSTGYIIPKELVCSECKGRKLIRTKKEITVEIEVGMENGEHIVLEKQGDEYPGKETADLVLIVSQKAHSDFTRDGDDLYYTKNLSIIEQKSGTAFSIKTLDGRTLDVCTEDGKPIDITRLKWIPNEGMPCKGNDQFRGNLYIIFEKGFPGPIHESVRTIKSLFNKLVGGKILLQDAPEEKQEQYKEMLKQQQEAIDEMIREYEERRAQEKIQKQNQV
jgi:DnaJ-class molecular chaperone